MTVDRIGWALIHSLWQGGLLAALLAIALLATRRARPGVRYALAVGALALMVALPVATVVAPRASVRAGVRGVLGGAVPAPAARSASEAPAPAAEHPASTGGRGARPGTLPASRPGAWGEAPRPAQLLVERALPWLAIGWVAGVLLLSARLVGGLARARRLARDGTRAVDAAVAHVAARIAARLRVQPAVRVLESARAGAPLVVGFLRPAILLPASVLTGLAPAQLEMLLAHELAHVRRHDVLVNLAQTFAETLLFFHPAAWWVSGRIREERENCCDDLALAACGGDAVEYSAVLLTLEEARGTGGVALAAASNGGPLLRRVARLLRRGPAHVDLGPRWLAGVLTIGVALLSASEAVGVTPRPGALRAGDVVGAQPPARKEGAKGATMRDSARWRPAAVVRLGGEGELAERWRRAERQASERAFGAYWVGYVVPGTRDGGEWFYMDRVTPVVAEGNTFTGRIFFGGPASSGWRFAGVALAPLFGEHPAAATTIFLRYDARDGRRALTNVHVARYELPMHFHALPVLWLDAAEGGESVALLRRLLAAERNGETREDLLAAVGMHRGVAAAVETLVAWMEGRDAAASLRRDAARWLGRQPDERAFRALARAARASDERGVRVEAVEALAHLPMPEAADTLIAFARELRDPAQRNEAIEGLGHRTERRAIDFLRRLVDGADVDVARRAVEALGNLPDGRGAELVIDVARHHVVAEVRRAAVEAVAEVEPTRRALDVLRDVAATDADAEVRVEAVEAIAEVQDARAVQVLRELAERGADVRVQVEATEALAGTVAPAEAIPLLGRLARTHPRAEVQRKAAEALGDFDDPRAVEQLAALAETHPDVSVQVEAAEALGAVHPHEPAIAALRRLARAHPSAAVRRRAAEALADYAEGGKR